MLGFYVKTDMTLAIQQREGDTINNVQGNYKMVTGDWYLVAVTSDGLLVLS